MREGALDRKRDSVSVTLRVCERATGEMALRAAFLSAATLSSSVFLAASAATAGSFCK